MASVADDTTSDKATPPKDEGDTGEKSGRTRPRPRESAKQVAHGAKVGSDVIRSRIASVIWIIAVVCAVILAFAAVLTALDPANEQNSVVQWLTSTADVLAGPLGGKDGGIFDFGNNDDAKNALANWGLAAVLYLVLGKVLDRVIRP